MRLSANVVAAAAGLTLLAAPAAAQAAVTEPPLNLAGAYVLDVAGALDGREAEVKEALDKLYDRTQTGLFVVLVDDFDGAACSDWANETAGLSGLGDADVLLAIAVDEREFCPSVADNFPLSDARLDEVADSGFISKLRSDDYAGGVVEYANDLSAALTRTGGDTSGGGFPVVPVIGGVAVVGIGAWAVSRAVRKRRGGGSTGGSSSATAPAGAPSQEELDKQAGSLLIALDDAVRESEQELGFAEAQFGAAAVATYQKTLADAKDKLQRAFAIRQQLDDTTPETPDQRRSLTTQLIELCSQADAALDAQADEFSKLRNLETSAPQVLETVRSAHGALAGRIATAEATVARLTSEFGAAAVDSVDENPAQARELATYASESIASADSALTASQASDAAVAVNNAQQAVDQATQLLDAVDALATELPQTADRLAAATAALTTAVAEAKAAGGGDAALATAIGSAERALAAAQAGDPVARLEAVEKATSELDAALATVRDAQAAAAASRQQYERVRATARERIRQAESYITTRRGGIGASARTRLAEAERLLAQSAGLAVSQPADALDAAQRAISHADAALQLARSDVARFGPQSGMGGNMGIGIPGVVLGGLGGSRAGGFGGSARRGATLGSARTTNSFPASSGSSRRTGGATGSSRSSGSSRGERRGGGGRF